MYEKNIIFTNKEPVNIDKKKDSDTKDDENKQDENGCVVCDSEGGICCPVSGDSTEENLGNGCVVCDSEGGICCPVTGE